MEYVSVIAMQFGKGLNGTTIKARGNMISKAVDIAEVIKRTFGNIEANVKIGTDEMMSKKNPERTDKVSTIDIELIKGVEK